MGPKLCSMYIFSNLMVLATEVENIQNQPHAQSGAKILNLNFDLPIAPNSDHSS